jgi:hypothetical protein
MKVITQGIIQAFTCDILYKWIKLHTTCKANTRGVTTSIRLCMRERRGNVVAACNSSEEEKLVE